MGQGMRTGLTAIKAEGRERVVPIPRFYFTVEVLLVMVVLIMVGVIVYFDMRLQLK